MFLSTILINNVLKGMNYMKIIDKIALALVIIGAINWLLVGLFSFNLVDTLCGAMSFLSRIIYVLIGVAGLWAIRLLFVDYD